MNVDPTESFRIQFLFTIKFWKLTKIIDHILRCTFCSVQLFTTACFLLLGQYLYLLIFLNVLLLVLTAHFLYSTYTSSCPPFTTSYFTISLSYLTTTAPRTTIYSSCKTFTQSYLNFTFLPSVITSSSMNVFSMFSKITLFFL